MISFIPLEHSHFPLLLKWLQTPHVKAWWDADLQWDSKLIEEKYSRYLHHAALKAYIICENDKPIGYIQYYNVQDFPDEENPQPPENCAAIDFYIGEPEYLRLGKGSNAIMQFIEDFIFSKYNHVSVAPDTANTNAIKTYKKAGFRIIKSDTKITWMLKTK